LGKTDQKVEDLPRPIEKILVHPEFDAQGKFYDIALIKLSEKVEFSSKHYQISQCDKNKLIMVSISDSIQPIKLSLKDTVEQSSRGSLASAVSFKIQKENGSQMLMQLRRY
jgi:Trypsin